jgi:DNA-binding MarR family transcriptional regulator
MIQRKSCNYIRIRLVSILDYSESRRYGINPAVPLLCVGITRVCSTLDCWACSVNTSLFESFGWQMKMQVSNVRPSVRECAHEILDGVPFVWRAIRAEFRKHGAQEISVPQYRTLAFVYRNEGASLSEVGDYIGLTLPTMSQLVDGLVTHGLINRRTDPEDRRRMTLTLTEPGRARLESARTATMAYLEGRLRQLSPSDRATITLAMSILREAFAGGKNSAKN